MLDRLWDVAPPGTWLVLSVAATLLLAAFILLSHTLVRSKAYGDAFDGLAAPGRLEWTLRVGAACLLGGVALWGLELGWPIGLLIALTAGAVAGLGLEVVALTKR
jgi:hypothetical protein